MGVLWGIGFLFLVGVGIVVVSEVGGLGFEVEVRKKYGGGRVGLVVRMWEGWRWGMWVGG